MKKMYTLFATSLALTALIAQGGVLNIGVSQDTFVRSDQADSILGSDNILLVGDHASIGPFNSFYKFDLSHPDLVDATINSVSLRLTSIAEAGAGTVNLNLYQLAAANSDWVQGTSGFTGSGATYNNKDRITSGDGPFAWAGGNTNTNLVAGTDYVNSVLGNFTGTSNLASGGETFDFGNATFASLVQSSLGGNLDLIIMGQTGANSNFLRIASLENTTYAAPQLIIDYTAIPEPGTLVLVGVALGALVLFRRK